MHAPKSNALNMITDANIIELLDNVSYLVAPREIIDQGRTRRLPTESESGDGFELAAIGDDRLARQLRHLADRGAKGHLFADLDVGDLTYVTERLAALQGAYLGGCVRDYVAPDEEDQLRNLDKLIEIAGQFAWRFPMMQQTQVTLASPA